MLEFVNALTDSSLYCICSAIFDTPFLCALLHHPYDSVFPFTSDGLSIPLFMASGINIYSELLISRIQILDIKNCNSWYQEFELLISAIPNWWYQEFEFLISAIQINVNSACHIYCKRRKPCLSSLQTNLCSSLIKNAVVCNLYRLP